MVVCCAGLVTLSERYPVWDTVRPVGAFPICLPIPPLEPAEGVSVACVSCEVEVTGYDVVFPVCYRRHSGVDLLPPFGIGACAVIYTCDVEAGSVLRCEPDC